MYKAMTATQHQHWIDAGCGAEASLTAMILAHPGNQCIAIEANPENVTKAVEKLKNARTSSDGWSLEDLTRGNNKHTNLDQTPTTNCGY